MGVYPKLFEGVYPTCESDEIIIGQGSLRHNWGLMCWNLIAYMYIYIYTYIICIDSIHTHMYIFIYMHIFIHSLRVKRN